MPRPPYHWVQASLYLPPLLFVFLPPILLPTQKKQVGIAFGYSKSGHQNASIQGKELIKSLELAPKYVVHQSSKLLF
jgi:hypothetical protein